MVNFVIVKAMQNRSEHSKFVLLARRFKYFIDMILMLRVLCHPDEKFDFTFSHSVLSHGCRSQLEVLILVVAC